MKPTDEEAQEIGSGPEGADQGDPFRVGRIRSGPYRSVGFTYGYSRFSPSGRAERNLIAYDKGRPNLDKPGNPSPYTFRNSITKRKASLTALPLRKALWTSGSRRTRLVPAW